MIITDEVLARINAGRAAKGLPPLEKQTAIKAATTRRQLAVDQGSTRDQSSDFLMHFLIGYGTGIPLPSAGGLIGAAMHSASQQHDSKPSKVDVNFSEDFKPFPATETPSSKSDDRYSSSSSYDSGSSSGGSSDSGASGGGGGE